MKLLKILSELELPKNKWIGLNDSEVDEIKDNLFDLISTAYRGVEGGNLNYKTPSDVTKDNVNYIAIDIDEYPDVDAILGFKKTNFGSKYVVMGHKGTKDTKRTVITKNAEVLKEPKSYLEGSGKIAEILAVYNVSVIDDEDTVRKVINKDDIEWLGKDGKYTRSIGGKKVTKQLFGKINV